MSSEHTVPVPGDAVVVVWGVIAASIWGTSYVAAKQVVQWLPPIAAAAIRFAMVAVLLWVAKSFAPDRQWRTVDRGDWVGIALAGLFLTSFQFALQYAGVGLTTASKTSIIANTRPIFVAVLSVLVLREAPTLRRVGGILLAFAGIAVLTTEGSLAGLTFRSEHLRGDLLILCNAISGAIGLVLTKRVLNRYSAFQTLVLTQTFGALGLLPMGLTEIVRLGGFPAAPALPFLLLVYQAVFCTIVSHLLWNRVLGRIEASRASVFLYFAPIVTTVLSVLLLDEELTWYLVAGATLVIGGAYATMSSSDAAADQP